MNIKIKVKRISKLKEFLSYDNYDTNSGTVGELIAEMVAFNVAEYNKKRDKTALFLVSDETAAAMADAGKISFGTVENKRKVDVKIMQDEAAFQFVNGRFKIINETKKHEYTNVDEPLNLSEGDALVFIKLTLLSGRWF
ncbi:MAG: hypothetical protein FWD58_02295 [Firmicutes bacterium]|nr:hypothetical protein [Bacillota bacterium]